jgi:hypothetical protein
MWCKSYSGNKEQSVCQVSLGRRTQSGGDEGHECAWQVRWCCPNRLLATSERIDGLSIGGRQLLALRLAVEKLAGPEAVAKMTLLLHLAEEMEEPVLADLRAHNLYG